MRRAMASHIADFLAMDYTMMDDVMLEPHTSVPCTIGLDCSKAQADLQLVTPDLTAPSRLPNIKRVAHSAEDWKPFKALIEELWIDKNITFKQLAAVLADEHGFYTTKRQFDRITEKWGLRKNMRKEEMIVIVRTQRERARKGKPTAVRIHGQELLGAKIARWEQRHRDGKELLEFDPSAASPLQYIEFSPRNPQEPERSRYYLRYSSVGIMDSPKFTRMDKALKEDSKPDCDEIPLLDLDSSSRSFEADRAWDITGTTSLEANTARNIPSPVACYVQTNYGVCLVSEIYPFPMSIAPKAPKLISPSSLPYKRAEEMRYRNKLVQLKQQFDRVDTPEYLQTLMQLAEVFMKQRKYNDARRMFWHVSQTRERNLGYEHEDTLQAAGSLAQAIFSQGKHSEAEPHIRRLYEAAPRVMGPDHEISVATTMLMSSVALKFGNVQEMKRLAREVLQICLQTYGPRHEASIHAMCHLCQELDPDERETIARTALDICKNGGEGLQEAAISAAREVAFALRSKDQNQKSLELFQDVLERSRKVFGPDDRASLQFQSEVSHSLIFVNKLADAEKLSRQTFLQQRKVPGSAVYEGLYTMEVYAFALVNLKRYPEAEQRFIKIINALENLCGKFHFDSVAVITDLGNMYEEQERFDDAIALYTQKYQEFEEARIENTPGSRILFLLARTLYNANRAEDAAVYFRKLIDMQIRLVGETHDDTLIYYEWLGDCYAHLKQWDQQLKLYQEKHEQLQSSAVENEYTLRIWYLLGTSLRSAEKIEESEKCFVSLIERQEMVLGIADEAVITTYESLGDDYDRDERYDDEIALYQAKLGQLRSFAIEKEQTLRVWYLLGVAFSSAGRLDEAIECLKTLIPRQEKVLGTTNKATINNYEFLGDCYHKAERFDDLIAHYQQKRDQLLLAGDETEQSLRIFFLLPYSFFQAKKYLEAATHFKVLIEKQERILGQVHKDTLRSYRYLTNCYREEQRYDDVMNFCNEKIERFQSVEVGEEQFCTLVSHLALILYRVGYYKYAMSCLEIVIAKLEELFGENHLPALEARVWLGWCYEARHRYSAALAAYEVALDRLMRLKAAGKEANESLVTLLGEDIPKMKEHIANGEGEEESSDEEDSGDESEEGDTNGSEMAWEDYVDLDGLEDLVDVENLIF